MKTKTCFPWSLLYLIILLAGLPGKGLCTEKPLIKTGDVFPMIELNPSLDAKESAYLGISGKTPFLISDVQADLLLVEVMNINCGHCQQQAPVYNQLFSLIESSPDTKGRIKIMAISSGNQDKYIQQFRDHFETLFPIIEDPALKVYDALGKPGVPLAIYVRLFPEDKIGVVAGTQEGFIEDYQAQFKEMRDLMQQGPASLQKVGGAVEDRVSTVAPLLTEEELKEKIRTAFNFSGRVEKIELDQYGPLFSFEIKKQNRYRRLFAQSVSEPPPCDQCHDVHFIYVFDETGKLQRLIPVSLPKYGNKKWDDTDMEKMWEKLAGSNIKEPMVFDE